MIEVWYNGGMAGKKAKARPEGAETVSIRLFRLSEVARWDRNPKEHDLGAIMQSIERYGFRDAPIFDEKLGAIAAGNGRIATLGMMKDAERPRPRGIGLAEDGEWLVPVQVGLDASSRQEAEAFGIDHNNLTVQGGRNGPEATLRLWDETFLADVLTDLSMHGAAPITLDGDDLDAMLRDLSAPPSSAGSPGSTTAESPHHDDDGRAEKPTKRAEFLKGGMPLAIVLDQGEMAEWRAAKSRLGCEADKAALLRLMRGER